MENYLISVVLTAGINLALLVPLFAFGFLTSPRQNRLAPLLLFAVFFLLDVSLLFLFKVAKVIPFWGGWNWQGKILELAWPLLLAALVPAYSATRIGLRFRTNPGSWRVLLVVCIGYVAVAVPIMLFMGAHFSLHVKLPDFLYEATIPGLGEEFVYRGVLLMLLNDLFGRPWRVLGAQFGWGLVISSVMFGLLHGIDARSFTSIHIYWIAMIFPFLTGIVLAWLRERSGSIWPCVVFHNFVNILNTLFV